VGSVEKKPDEADDPGLAKAMRICVLCNDADPSPPSGDPLEVALLEAAGEETVGRLRSRYPRLAEVPFDSERKRMSTLHRTGGRFLLAVKGAPEAVIGRSRRALDAAGVEQPLNETGRVLLLERAQEMARTGMRILALGQRELSEVPGELEVAEEELTLVGLAALRDPTRPEAAGAVAQARSAGIGMLMVTGDHPGTALSIAEEVGIADGKGAVLTGRDLRARGLPEDPLAVPIYSRVDPGDKLALVEALQSRGHVVAVTGDGVNDAPALRRADVGVAMGRSGTGAAREAADIVITDDNLATIVAAVREGRGIYDNIRKVVEYLVAANLSEVAVVVGALVAFPALGVPLLPLQLLWINFVTDGLPAVALGVDPPEPALMRHPPRPAGMRLLDRRRMRRLLVRGLVLAAASLASLGIARYLWGEPWSHARGLMFTVLATSQLLYAFALRRPHGTGVRQETAFVAARRMLANPWLLVGVGAGIALQVLIVAWEPARELFGAAWLTAREWGLVAAAAAAPALVVGFLTGREEDIGTPPAGDVVEAKREGT
jgi:Ca2+-transporting ATPase